jgi:hypothetical protein
MINGQWMKAEHAKIPKRTSNIKWVFAKEEVNETISWLALLKARLFNTGAS